MRKIKFLLFSFTLAVLLFSTSIFFMQRGVNFDGQDSQAAVLFVKDICPKPNIMFHGSENKKEKNVRR